MVQRKRWLARAALLVGAGLLALVLVAATAVASPKQQAKKGETFVVELSTDIDYIDPQLDYLSSGWEIQYAVGCKLFNYPDKPGDAGWQLTPEAAVGARRLQGRQDLHVQDPPRDQVLDRRGGHGGELRERDQPDRLAGAAVAGRVLHRHHRRAPTRR